MTVKIALACSKQAQTEILTDEALVGLRSHIRLVAPGDLDAEVALVTRDVWGTSTDSVLQPHTRDFFQALGNTPNLRWVHTYASGLDRPVYQSLMKRGVRVTNTAGANADAVAQTALAGFLYFTRNLHIAQNNQQKREWRPIIHAEVPALSRLHCLIVGWGEIGQRIGSYLNALGVQYSVLRQGYQPVHTALDTASYGSFNAWVGQADWVFFACPLSDSTRHLFNPKTVEHLSQDRPLSVVNVARGGVIDTLALLDAHAKGLIKHAHLDVFEQEPLVVEHPLWRTEGILVSPHMAGAADNNRQRVLIKFGEQLLAYAACREP